MKRDENGAFTLLFGEAKKDGDYKLVSHLKIPPENSSYLGFSEQVEAQFRDYEKNNKDKKSKTKMTFKTDKNPWEVVTPLVIKNSIWVKDKIEKKETGITIERGENLAKIADKLNAGIDKEWQLANLDAKIYPKPKGQNLKMPPLRSLSNSPIGCYQVR